MKKLAAFYLLLTTCLCASAQIPAQWNAETSADEPYSRTVFRGESLALTPEWTSGGRPLDTNGWAFTAWWSTNGVSWWGKGYGPDPTLTVTGDPFAWTPDMDTGARQHRLFIRAQSPSGDVSYRANARLTMLDSPGYTPNALPLPIPMIDFGATAYLNAPWLLPDALLGFATEAWTLAAIAAHTPPQVESDPIALPVANAASNLAANAYALALTNATPPPDLTAYLRRDAKQEVDTNFSLRSTTNAYTSLFFDLGFGGLALGIGDDYTQFNANFIAKKQGAGVYLYLYPTATGTIALTQDITDATNTLAQTDLLPIANAALALAAQAWQLALTNTPTFVETDPVAFPIAQAALAGLDGKVDKLTVNGWQQAYILTSAGQPSSLNISAGTSGGFLVLRDSTGQLAVLPTPTNTNHATSKGYVDTAVGGRVPISTAAAILYATSGGVQTTIPYSAQALTSTMAYRGAGATLAVGTPQGGQDATTRNYVDNLAAGKLPMVTSSGTARAYGVDSAGVQTMYSMHASVNEAYNGWIPLRGTGGQINVPLAPTANNHATSKAYIDAGLAGKLSMPPRGPSGYIVIPAVDWQGNLLHVLVDSHSDIATMADVALPMVSTLAMPIYAPSGGTTLSWASQFLQGYKGTPTLFANRASSAEPTRGMCWMLKNGGREFTFNRTLNRADSATLLGTMRQYITAPSTTLSVVGMTQVLGIATSSSLQFTQVKNTGVTIPTSIIKEETDELGPKTFTLNLNAPSAVVSDPNGWMLMLYNPDPVYTNTITAGYLWFDHR